MNKSKSNMSKKLKIILGIMLMVGVTIMGVSYATTIKFDKDTQQRIDSSTHYRDGRFSGPAVEMTAAGLWNMISERLWGENKESRVASSVLPRKEVDLELFNQLSAGKLNATWLGHSSLMINIDGYRVLTDPVFPKKVTIVGPTRYNGELPLDPDELSNIDIVIISHDHYDHLNKESVLLLSKVTNKFLVPLGVKKRLTNWGIASEKIVELDWWEEYSYDEKLTLAATPGQHFSGRSLNDRNKTLWASWVIKTDNHNAFFGGDTGYFDGFKEIGAKYGPFDMTFLECGAYNEAWSQIHMYPEQTVQAHLDLDGKVLHPIHWGTFNLSFHSWNEPMVRFSKAAKAAGVIVTTPIVGETTEYGNGVHTYAWWMDNKESEASELVWNNAQTIGKN